MRKKERRKENGGTPHPPPPFPHSWPSLFPSQCGPQDQNAFKKKNRSSSGRPPALLAFGGSHQAISSFRVHQLPETQAGRGAKRVGRSCSPTQLVTKSTSHCLADGKSWSVLSSANSPSPATKSILPDFPCSGSLILVWLDGQATASGTKSTAPNLLTAFVTLPTWQALLHSHEGKKLAFQKETGGSREILGQPRPTAKLLPAVFCNCYGNSA